MFVTLKIILLLLLSLSVVHSNDKDSTMKIDINKHVKELMKVCDKNHNNVIELSEVVTEKEWQVLSKKQKIVCYFSDEELESINKNKDNILTEKEFLSTYKKDMMSIGYPIEETEKKYMKKNIKKEIEKMKTLPKYMQLYTLFSLCNENDDFILTLDEAKKCKIDVDTFTNLDSDGNHYLDQNDTLLQREELKIFMQKHLD